MPDEKPTLEYAGPAVKTRRKIPWSLRIPLAVFAAFAVLLAIVVLLILSSLVSVN